MNESEKFLAGWLINILIDLPWTPEVSILVDKLLVRGGF